MPVKLTDINFIFTDIPFEVVELNSYISMKIYVRPSIKGLLKNFNMKMQKSFELYERFKNIEEEVNNLVIVIIPKIGSSLITYQNGVVLIRQVIINGKPKYRIILFELILNYLFLIFFFCVIHLKQ